MKLWHHVSCMLKQPHSQPAPFLHGLSLPTQHPCAQPLLETEAMHEINACFASFSLINILRSISCSLRDHTARFSFPTISMGVCPVRREQLSLSQPSHVIPGG